tara:strand:+ start:352 stop:495 length:144 start_codon:yes stop_codon:yes gene_type:complete
MITITEKLPAEAIYCGRGGMAAVENRNTLLSIELSLDKYLTYMVFKR